MKRMVLDRRQLCGVALGLTVGLTSCGSGGGTSKMPSSNAAADRSRYIVSVIDEPDTVDFQCTSIHYTVALNTFDRLVETEVRPDGSVGVVPSLAESWEISDDGREYTFHLREGVTFSNGAPLTSSDVLYSFTRLLTHPDSCNSDIVSDILGADKLGNGEASQLEGFRVVDDLTFVISLQQPFAAFLACLCMPGASIMNEESAEAAGERFGVDPEATMGTGPFILKEWNAGTGLVLEANPHYWAGELHVPGLDLRFAYEPEVLAQMFDDGELDILNLDSFGELSEYYMHGDVYEDQLHTAQHVGIDYIALNESVKPLDDVRVRKALQLALNRQTLLEAVYDGAGQVEQGIYPHGLIGFNPDLDPIPYDPDAARQLLAEAGLQDGFDFEVRLSSTVPERRRKTMDLAADMWEKIGVHADIVILPDDDFMKQRKAGEIPCFTANWAADYDDPDNFIYTFFGTKENTTFRSLCYDNEEVMARVRAARAITDEEERIKEYQDLERIIVQEDAAWIPLFSKERSYLVSDKIETFAVGWNGWFETSYKYMVVRGSGAKDQ